MTIEGGSCKAEVASQFTGPKETTKWAKDQYDSIAEGTRTELSTIDKTLAISRLKDTLTGGSITNSVEKMLVLQKALSLAGYNPGNIDGVYGGLTKKAIEQLQTDYGLIVDGKVYMKDVGAGQTFDQLVKILQGECGNQVAPPTAAAPAPAPAAAAPAAPATAEVAATNPNETYKTKLDEWGAQNVKENNDAIANWNNSVQGSVNGHLVYFISRKDGTSFGFAIPDIGKTDVTSNEWRTFGTQAEALAAAEKAIKALQTPAPANP